MNFFNIGPMELLLILVLVLIVFGPNKIPEIGASLGKTLRQFREATREMTEGIDLEELSPSTILDVLEAQAGPDESPPTEGQPASAPVETAPSMAEAPVGAGSPPALPLPEVPIEEAVGGNEPVAASPDSIEPPSASPEGSEEEAGGEITVTDVPIDTSSGPLAVDSAEEAAPEAAPSSENGATRE